MVQNVAAQNLAEAKRHCLLHCRCIGCAAPKTGVVRIHRMSELRPMNRFQLYTSDVWDTFDVALPKRMVHRMTQSKLCCYHV